MFLFFRGFQPGCSYELFSYKKKGVPIFYSQKVKLSFLKRIFCKFYFFHAAKQKKRKKKTKEKKKKDERKKNIFFAIMLIFPCSLSFPFHEWFWQISYAVSFVSFFICFRCLFDGADKILFPIRFLDAFSHL